MAKGDALYWEREEWRRENPSGCQPSDCCGDPAAHDAKQIMKRMDRVAKEMYEKAVPDFPWEAIEKGSATHGLWLGMAEDRIAAGHADEPHPLSGATVLQSGDRVLLCFSEAEFTEEFATRMQGDLHESFPNIRFSLITGVTGVLIDRGNDDSSVRKADDS